MLSITGTKNWRKSYVNRCVEYVVLASEGVWYKGWKSRRQCRHWLHILLSLDDWRRILPKIAYARADWFCHIPHVVWEMCHMNHNWQSQQNSLAYILVFVGFSIQWTSVIYHRKTTGKLTFFSTWVLLNKPLQFTDLKILACFSIYFFTKCKTDYLPAYDQEFTVSWNKIKWKY